MTEKEFLALAPREQDAVVAEKVMGWRKPSYVPDPHTALTAKLSGDPFRDGPWFLNCEYQSGDVPFWESEPYTTDISAAWEVVEKMQSGGFWVGLDSLVDTPDMNWRCEIRGLRAMWKPVWGAAPTAPLAICIAALMAVGEIHD